MVAGSRWWHDQNDYNHRSPFYARNRKVVMLALFNIGEKVIADYLTNPENLRSIQSYIFSSDGKKTIGNFLNNPQGQKIIHMLMPQILDHLDIPEEEKESIRKSLVEKE
jgi:hypothetical protein